jgi:hypothetical protein
LGSIISNDARDIHAIKSWIDMAKAEFNEKILFVSKLGLNSRKKLSSIFVSWLCREWKVGHSGKCIRNT